MKTTKHLGLILLCFQMALFPAVAKAQLGAQTSFLDYVNSQANGPADFLVKRFPNQKLIPIKLVGGVNRPGFYQIPEDTTLTSLLAYSAGAAQTADIENIAILRAKDNKTLTYSLKELMDHPEYKDPVLSSNDVVYIYEKKQWFSNNTVTALAVTSSILAIVLSSYLIRDRVEGKY